ncbi:MAG TPA: GNAT family N-acetyltransferase [Alphaproteobacteria bacterium]|nr:GNAT family N-acetyltransferase [Alphaproteobacteria bacterium]
MIEAAAQGAKLRDARPGDGAELQRVYGHHVLHGFGSFEETPPDIAEMERRCAAVQKHGLPYIVAEAGSRLLGFAYAGRYRPRSGYRFTVEDSVYVAPEAMGQGLGRRLLAEVVARAEAAGMRQMIAVIGDSGNIGSIHLHERLGFSRAGLFAAVGWKGGRWLDSVLMQRALGEGCATAPEPVYPIG